MTGAIFAVCGYVGIMGGQYANPRSELSRTDGICRIGIQADAAIAVTVFDTVMNFSLTAMFLWQMRPALKNLANGFGHNATLSTQEKRMRWPIRSVQAEGLVGQTPMNTLAHKNVQCMLIRNVVGSALLLVNVIVNNAVFIRYSFAKMAHACLLMCLTDSECYLRRYVQFDTNVLLVVVGMLVTHWLTMRAAEEVDDSRRATTFSPYSTSSTSVPQAMRSRRATLDYSMLRADTIVNVADKASPISNMNLELEKVTMPAINR